jgi:LmbE family N-acetylglucosaminyl deacetylase
MQTITDIRELGTILGLWAHPDDETFMSGGLMAQAIANGQQVMCVTATKGEAGVYDSIRWPAETIGAQRALELADALRIIGVQYHEWLHYTDGACRSVPDDTAVGQIVQAIGRYQPDTIITFPPDGLTGHEDHKTVSRWARLVAQKLPKPPRVLYAVNSVSMYENHLKEADEKLNIYFNLDKPDLYQDSECDLVAALSPDALLKKCRGFEAMPSQYAAWLELFSFDYLRRAFANEYYILAGNEHR